jgi:hypothetical protein
MEDMSEANKIRADMKMEDKTKVDNNKEDVSV